MPIIGITTYGRNEEKHFALPAVYVDAVRRAGGVPILLPPGEAHLDALLPHLDGLILAGGGDIDPAHYGGDPHEAIYMIDAERDRSELTLARRIVETDTPALCICRGIQVLNVALGGTLVEHLPDEKGNAVEHRLAPHGPTYHPIEIAPGSRLAAILDGQQAAPTSWHHQAVRRVADGLRPVAYAPDGTVEAVEATGATWVIGVQWHPEMTAADDPQQQRIFDEFVAAARRFSLARRQKAVQTATVPPTPSESLPQV